MGKCTLLPPADADDPIYREGPTIFTPRMVRKSPRAKVVVRDEPDEPQADPPKSGTPAKP